MTRIAIIKTGRTFPSVSERFGDFEDWFINALGPGPQITVIDVTRGDSCGPVADWDGIVVTGSPAMVTDRADWSEATAKWLAEAVEREIPVLGVCYGHQLLAHGTGGQVDNHPRGRESGTHCIRLHEAARQDPLFEGLPERFPAHLTHRQSVISLPPGAVLLASTDFEPHQAYRIGRCAWGVQFHPEFSAEVMRAYLEIQADSLRAENQRPETLLAAVTDTPEATGLLRRFLHLVTNRSSR